MSERVANFWGIAYRPFFLAALLYSIVSITIWLLLYATGANGLNSQFPAAAWHGHEMVFAYSTAVIAGFLLTAIRNWTQLETLAGPKLMLLILCWLLPRLLFFIPGSGVALWIAILDLSFLLFLIAAVVSPLIKSRQWKQSGIASKLLFLWASNACFYAGILWHEPQWVRIGIYSALYMVIALVLVMARRLIPFFVNSATSITVRNRLWVDRSSLVLYLAFWVAVVFYPTSTAVTFFAATLVPLHLLRLADWYVAEIWQRPLLWVLYAAYLIIVLGMALKALEVPLGISPFLALHAFAFGGVGLMTAGMMARVSWGHSGRDIANPPQGLSIIFFLLLFGTICRVLLPIFWPSAHIFWILSSGSFWVLAYALLFALYFRVLR